MCLTTLKVPVENEFTYLKIETYVNKDQKTVYHMHMSDQDLKNIKLLNSGIVEKNEKEYHVDIRKKANSLSHYCKALSSNPEWDDILEKK